MKYNWNDIETKWQKHWKENQTFKASNNSNKPKFYVLDMFPYPSGSGLHVGHPLGYIASDIYARYKRNKGFNVLHPMGFDSFGLPAEQYAIQTGQHPSVTTKTNINTYKRQLNRMGFSFDWSREIKTSDPSYYKWTQWIFIQLFHSWYNKTTDKAENIETLIHEFEQNGNKKVKAATDYEMFFSAENWKAFNLEEQQKILLTYRLAYLADTEVNWCPELGTVLANDEIVNGVSERGGHPVIKKKMKQWIMRITAYAPKLLNGLENIDWSNALKESQRNWIGKSTGVVVCFNLKGFSEKIQVFTTRPDTIFGVSFMVLAPEHELVSAITTADKKEEVNAYIKETLAKSEVDRMANKKVSGAFTGAYAIHPFSKKEVPIFISDYVLASYGTGAVMAVPCGDQRDYLFAKHFDLQIPNIFKDIDISKEAHEDKAETIIDNSDFLNGLSYKEAFTKSILELEKIDAGIQKVNYKLRDAVFSRQRYWGEPIPIYYKKGLPYTIDEKYLPIQLPEVSKYLPTSSGEPPLGNATHWAWDSQQNKVVSNEKINQPHIYPLELNTMPGWAGSSWYFNRYMDNSNELNFVSSEALSYWKQVDLYIGGNEHATGHLLYARFWQKFLYDRGWVNEPEFAQKLINQGMILGTSAIVYRVSGTQKYVSKNLKDKYNTEEIRVDITLINASNELDLEAFKAWQPQFANAEFIAEEGVYVVGREVEKMSKRWHNVENPDRICELYGADSLRLYEMFLGPLEQYKPWNTAGISGVHSFLKKLWRLYFDENGLRDLTEKPSAENLKTLHKTIKKVTYDIDNFSFNTSVSNFMIAVNELTAQKCKSQEVLKPLLVLISPYAPHICEELWQQLGATETISFQPFPLYDEKYLTESEKAYPISFNGKVRFTLSLATNLTEDEIEQKILNHEKTKEQLNGKTPKRVFVVPGKIVNIVC